jgi:polysaccharide biosynthesis transport protein
MLKRLDSVEDRQFETGVGPNPADSGKFDLRAAINFAWRQWKFILGVTLLALLLGALHVSRQTSLYTATAQLLLDPQRTNAPGQAAGANDGMADLDDIEIESQIAVLRSALLLGRVVSKGKLVNDPEFGASPATVIGPIVPGGNPLATIRSWFIADASSSGDEKRADSAKSEVADPGSDAVATVDYLQGGLAISRAGQARVLNVSFTSADPRKAANLANAIADAYVVDKLDTRFEATQRASVWLNDRLVELKGQLRTAEEAVDQFRSQNNLEGAAPGTSLNQEQLGQLNGRLVSARAETADKKARLDLLQKFLNAGGGFENLPESENGAMGDLRKQQADLERQLADLLSRYNDRHPLVVNVRAQLADVKRNIIGEAKRMASDVQHDYDLALARQQAVEKTLREVTGENDLDQTKAITLRELERNVAVNKTLFEDFLQRAKITQEQSTFEARDARVITPARPPGSPSSPNRTRVMMLSLLLGLAGGVGGAYLIEMLNAGFTTPREVEDVLGLPLLASISRMKARDLTVEGVTLSMPQYLQLKPLSRFSESVRSLRGAVQMSDVDHPPRTLLVTSALPNEGKSTIALTIAASASQSGLRVLLVDADLRHPSSSRYFNFEKKVGLVDYLVGSVEISEAITFDAGLRLWVLLAGGKTQNPPDLLGSEKFKTTVEILRSQFDLIVFDAPPTGPVVDPQIIAQVVDKVVFVVRWAKTARELVAHSIERFPARRKIAGIVFNQVVDAQAQKYGHAYSYYYGNHYLKKYYDE